MGVCGERKFGRRRSGESGEHPARRADHHSSWSRQEEDEESVWAPPQLRISLRWMEEEEDGADAAAAAAAANAA